MGEQLTESDVKKIKEEIEYRKIVVRKKELEAVKEARAQGDLSENFEYKAAKQDKNRNESRIRYLERMLKTANIVSDDSKEDEIGINNTVDLYFEDDEEVETYRIVTSVRGNSLAGLISIESPLGKAVLGHKVGDRVKIPAGDDGYYVVVKRIDKTTDDSHDTLRKYSKSEKIFLRILQRKYVYTIREKCAIINKLVKFCLLCIIYMKRITNNRGLAYQAG